MSRPLSINIPPPINPTLSSSSATSTPSTALRSTGTPAPPDSPTPITPSANVPKLRELILAAEELTQEMTQQVKQILKHEWTMAHDNYKKQSLPGTTAATGSTSSTAGFRPPPHPAAWVTPRELKDISIAVVGLGQIGAPLCDLLVRSGLRKLIVYDHGYVQKSDIACDVYKPAFVGHSKSQAVQLACFQLDNTLHVEAYVMKINNQDGTLSRFHHSLLTPAFIGQHHPDDKTGSKKTGRRRETYEEEQSRRQRKKKDGSTYLDMEKRKKIDLVVCCINASDARSDILHVCKSLNIPMLAIRILNSSSSGNITSKQGTVEFVLPRESKLYEPKQESDGRVAKGTRNEMDNFDSVVSNKVQPLGLLLAGLGANEIIKVISANWGGEGESGGGVPSFLRYDLSTGETSHRLPKR